MTQAPDWRGIVETVAPALATAFGSPMAGVAVRYASEALLGHPNGTHDDVAAAVAGATPDQLLALKTADNKFATDMEALGVDLKKAQLADVADSRSMAAKTTMRPQMVLTAIFLIGFFVILGCLLANVMTIPQATHDVVLMMITLIIREIPTIMQWWFGSSSSSKTKDETINQLSASE